MGWLKKAYKFCGTKFRKIGDMKRRAHLSEEHYRLIDELVAKTLIRHQDIYILLSKTLTQP